MKYFSTFSGIGGFELGIQSVIPDAECVGYSEIDKYACQVYQSHFPNHKNYGDITKIDIANLPDFDLLVGGSPCQDLSIAKKGREGLQGSRSGLFFKYVEILRIKKPQYFILENVNSMPKESKAEISKIMGVEPIMINASLVSAQNRKRLFWCNFPINQPEDRGILLRDILEPEVDAKYYLSEKGVRYALGGVTKNFQRKGEINPRKSFPLNATMAKSHRAGFDTYVTHPKRVGQLNKGGQGDRIYSADWSGNFVTVDSYSVYNKKITEGKATTLGSNPQCLTAKTGQVVRIGQLNNGGQGDRIYSADGKSVNLSANGGGRGAKTGLYLDKEQIRKLTPTECARLQCFPDGWCENIVSNSQAYKCYGNAVNVEVVKHIVACLVNGVKVETQKKLF